MTTGRRDDGATFEKVTSVRLFLNIKAGREEEEKEIKKGKRIFGEWRVEAECYVPVLKSPVS